MTGKPAKENISSHGKHEGGILLTALLFFTLFSGVLLLLLADYQSTQNFYLETRDLYTAKIMKEMFLDEYYTKPDTVKSPVQFSTGELTYKETDKLEVTVMIRGNKLVFHEKLKQ